MEATVPLSNEKQQEIQTTIDAASQEEREEMRHKAASKLNYLRTLKDNGADPGEYEGDAETAIEVLLRIEATENNKGLWFRTKRRMTLMKEYMIS